MIRRIGWLFVVFAFALAGPAAAQMGRADAPRPNVPIEAGSDEPALGANPAGPRSPSTVVLPWTPTPEDLKGFRSVAMIGLISLAPAALLMFTSFLRINIVFLLVRQALGIQFPGNQVFAVLALLITALVMQPRGKAIYEKAIVPYATGQITPVEAWEEGSRPIQTFMCEQILRTNHGYYLRDLHALAEPDQPEPDYADHYPLRVVAPAFLLSELTTALMIGFVIYLPFLVVDLVVSAVLSAMGLFMLPPSLVTVPLKLVLFVLADGWLLVSTALMRTFVV